ERAGLLSISPDLYLVGINSVRDLAAHRRRRLLAAAIVGAQRAVHIVETYDTRRQTIILRVVLAELLRIELLEAVTFFRLRGKRVLLAQRCYIRGSLQAMRIDAGRR